jgi:hypothetical protein
MWESNKFENIRYARSKGLGSIPGMGFFPSYFFFGPHSFAKYFFPPNFSLVFWKRKIWREKIYSTLQRSFFLFFFILSNLQNKGYGAEILYGCSWINHGAVHKLLKFCHLNFFYKIYHQFLFASITRTVVRLFLA